ncbi:MAG: hypothetical protein Kow0090_16390 [Myxococcota bacterium]
MEAARGKVKSPIGYLINSNDCLEYMPKNEDVAFLLLKLLQADEPREIKRREREEGTSEEEILRIVKERQEEFESADENNREEIRKLNVEGLSITQIIEKLGDLLQGLKFPNV